MRFLVTLAVVAAALVAGCAQEPWHGRDLDAGDPPWRSVEVPAGGGFELDKDYARGERVRWDWFVSEREPLRFDVHTHFGSGRVQVHHNETAAQAQGDLRAEEAGGYSQMWRHAGDRPVTLWYRVAEPHRATVIPAGAL